MSILTGWADRARGLFADTKGPWGPKGSGDEPEEPAPGPWGDSPKRGKRAPSGDPSSSMSSLDDFLRKSRARFSTGGGGGLPGRPNASMFLWVAIGLVDSPAVGWAVAAPFLVAGLGSGLVIAPNQTLALSEVPPRQGGAAGGVLQTGQRIGSAANKSASVAVAGAGRLAASDGTPGPRGRDVHRCGRTGRRRRLDRHDLQPRVAP